MTQHESHALWQIYCPSHEGVAIQTTWAQLTQSVNGLPVHPVRYVEPGSMKQTPGLTQLATEKRPMFAYEQEVRVVFKHPALEDPERETVGHGLEWDPETALENIWGHPDADFSFMEAVNAVVGRYAPALKGHVQWSAMQAQPPF